MSLRRVTVEDYTDHHRLTFELSEDDGAEYVTISSDGESIAIVGADTLMDVMATIYDVVEPLPEDLFNEFGDKKWI